MELFQFALKSINISGGEYIGRDIALRCPDTAARRPYLTKSPYDIQHVQPRWVTGISFRGLTRRNFFRSSADVAAVGVD